MICPQCGAEAEDQALFCGGCGGKLGRRSCPQCGSVVDAAKRFCLECGKRMDEPMARDGGQVEPGGRPPSRLGDSSREESKIGQRGRDKEAEAPVESKRKGRGCLGWGCILLSSFLVLVLLVVGVGAAAFFRVPQRLGLVKSPAEQILSGTPDRQAARDLRAELAKAGIETRGLDIYVFPMTGKDSSVAIAVLDSSKGFSFSRGRSRDPIIDFMSQLSTSKVAKEAGIERVALDYRNEAGKSLITLTAPTGTMSDFARGSLGREQLIEQLDGNVDVPALYEEFQKWVQ